MELTNPKFCQYRNFHLQVPLVAKVWNVGCGWSRIFQYLGFDSATIHIPLHDNVIVAKMGARIGPDFIYQGQTDVWGWIMFRWDRLLENKLPYVTTLGTLLELRDDILTNQTTTAENESIITNSYDWSNRHHEILWVPLDLLRMVWWAVLKLIMAQIIFYLQI